MKIKNIKLNKQQQKIFDAIKELSEGDELVKAFLIGFATGKTTLFRYVEEYFRTDSLEESINASIKLSKSNGVFIGE